MGPPELSVVDFKAIAELLKSLTFTAALVFILIGGYFRWWVWGHQLSECDNRWLKRDLEWKERLDKLVVDWERRYASRETELKGEIAKWDEENRRTSLLLDRSLALQEQRLRDQDQERQDQARRHQRGKP